MTALAEHRADARQCDRLAGGGSNDCPDCGEENVRDWHVCEAIAERMMAICEGCGETNYLCACDAGEKESER